MVQKVSGEMLEDGVLAGINTGFTPNNYVRASASGGLEERTPSQVQSDISAQPLDATLTALAAVNWQANGLAIGSGADTVAQVTFAINTFPARASTGNLVAKAITDFALTILDDVDAAAVRTTISAQPLDATLTALAAQNWAANALPIGSGADTLAQVTFAANTFPARTSTGNLVAKTITDSAAAMLAVAVSGTYTPVLTNITNVNTSTMALATWFRVNDTVTVFGTMNLTPTAAVATEFRITLPVASALSNVTELAGTFTNLDTTYTAGAIFANTANDAAEFRLIPLSTSNRVMTYHFSYRVI